MYYTYICIYIYLHMYAYVRAMCGWLDVLRSFLFLSSTRWTYGGGRERGRGGGVKICSFAFAFRSTLGFCLSSGTDCRVRRRMHAPFPGPYVSTLALNFNPILYILLFLLTLLFSSHFLFRFLRRELLHDIVAAWLKSHHHYKS